MQGAFADASSDTESQKLAGSSIDLQVGFRV